jgi:hypothetical protein
MAAGAVSAPACLPVVVADPLQAVERCEAHQLADCFATAPLLPS